MSLAVAKICRRCGRDVSTMKRVKDAAGRYYCQPCHAAGTPTAIATAPAQAIDSQTHTCTSCGSVVAEDAAFCARCGAKQGTNLSVDDEIDLASLIVDLRRYAELSTVLVMAPGVYAQMSETLRRAAAARDASGIANLNDLVAQAKVQEASCRREAEAIKARIGAFDSVRVQKVYDLIMVNATVPNEIKDGLGSDALGLFASTGVAPAVAEHDAPNPVSDLTQLAAAQEHRGPAAIGGTAGPGRKRRRTVSYWPLIGGIIGFIVSIGLGMVADQSSGLTPVALLMSMGSVATLLAWAVIAVVRSQDAGGDAASRPALPPANPAAPPRPGRRGTRPTPTGFYFCFGMIAFALLLWVIGGYNVAQSSELSTTAVKCFLVGLGLVVAAMIGFANACPKCHLLFTSEVLNTDSLGTHTESRTEQRTARHYPAGGGPAYGETKYDVERQVQVTTLVHTKHCKSCGHIWRASERREN